MCGECGLTPKQPAVCLFCRALVCAGSACCRVDGDDETLRCARSRQPELPDPARPYVCACRGMFPHRHARHCSGGVGVFLLIRLSTTLLCAGRRHSWWASLYLDHHGEEDCGLTRGRPLTLSANRLASLEDLWFSHGVREYVCHHPPSFPVLLLAPRERAAVGHGI